MTVEEKAVMAAIAVRGELNHPLFRAAPGAKRAIQAMADALEALAHEVEILKLRAAYVDDSVRCN